MCFFMTKQMYMMKNRVLFYLLFCLLGCMTRLHAQQFHVSETKYDYADVAYQIVDGQSDKMEQARSIYQWICENIAYDTTYQIYTADECWEQKKGVCQAYCELFYRLAEPLGLNTIIVSGKTKEKNGKVSDKGHSWLIVEVEDGGILIDPTWGAGGIKDNVFQRKENDMSWFHVDPYWMIFSHYPDDEQYQFLETPISWQSYIQLPTIYPILGDFGWNGKDILSKVLNGEIQNFPTVYEDYAEYLYLLDIPIQKTLRPGRFYDFHIRKKKDESIVLIHDNEFVHETEWKQDGNDFRIRYMPVTGGTLKISVAQGEKRYNSAVSYRVATPNNQELKTVEKYRPFRMPEMKRVKNLEINRLKSIGIDGHKLLAEIRRNGINTLPVLYKNAENFLSEVDVPYSETLYVGKSYSFSFIPLGGLDWQIINEVDWYGEWTVDEITGRMTIQVIPQKQGRLKVSVQTKEGGSYGTMLGYRVLEK